MGDNFSIRLSHCKMVEYFGKNPICLRQMVKWRFRFLTKENPPKTKFLLHRKWQASWKNESSFLLGTQALTRFFFPDFFFEMFLLNRGDFSFLLTRALFLQASGIRNQKSKPFTRLTTSTQHPLIKSGDAIRVYKELLIQWSRHSDHVFSTFQITPLAPVRKSMTFFFVSFPLNNCT